MAINHRGRIQRIGDQQYINRDYALHLLDDRVFDLLNDTDDDFFIFPTHGCLDALQELPAGSMVSYQPGGYDQSTVDRGIDEKSLNEAYELGYMARNYKACPFVSQPAFLEAWDLAMVEKAIDLGTMTPGMPLGVLSRIAFLKGEKMPAALAALPCADENRIAWHAGYLKQQDITNNTGFVDTIPGYAQLYARSPQVIGDADCGDNACRP